MSSQPGADTVLTIVGIGADGWDGLPGRARAALESAQVILGSGRQLAALPARIRGERVTWPMPLLPTLARTLHSRSGQRRVVLASGDPTQHGIASTIARLLPELELDIIAHPSSVSLACARLGWAQQDVDVVSLVGRPVAAIVAQAYPGRRLLILAEGSHSPAEVGRLLRGLGLGPSPMVALSNLGGADEQRVDCPAADWPDDGWPRPATPRPLTVLGIECVAGPGFSRLTLVPGLPDEAYEHDGQLTKRPVRAITLSSLAPAPGELLWDVGGGAGSIGIEWMRAHPSCRAICIERNSLRVRRIERNASALGVPSLVLVHGSAPAALRDLVPPDAVFIGGGLTEPGLVDTCWTALRPGGRLVANLATLESEQVVLDARTRYGGQLTRIGITAEAAVGRFTGWRPAMPVTQWVATKG